MIDYLYYGVLFWNETRVVGFQEGKPWHCALEFPLRERVASSDLIHRIPVPVRIGDCHLGRRWSEFGTSFWDTMCQPPGLFCSCSKQNNSNASVTPGVNSQPKFPALLPRTVLPVV